MPYASKDCQKLCPMLGVNWGSALGHWLQSAFHHFLSYPTRILAAIEYGRDQDIILPDLIIDGKWKPLREKPMVPKDNRMDAFEI
jgi:hypothetical protein